MTAMLIKTKRDHARLRARLTEDIVALVFSPVAGALAAGVNGTPGYSQQLSATNAIGNVVWQIASGSLPTGLSLNANTGLITGTPTETVAAKPVTMRATDGAGNTATVAYTITIAAA